MLSRINFYALLFVKYVTITINQRHVASFVDMGGYVLSINTDLSATRDIDCQFMLGVIFNDNKYSPVVFNLLLSGEFRFVISG